MNDDTIYRQAAIDAVLDRMDAEKHGRDAKPEEIRWTLQNLPSAQSKPRWIPCSERLPDTPDMVLVTIDWGDGDYEVSTDEYWSIDGVATEGWGDLQGGVVIAWMPLPEPYKGEQE